MSKVTVVRERWHGHSEIVLDDGKTVLLSRGAATPKVGDEWPKVLPSAADLDALSAERAVPIEQTVKAEDAAAAPNPPLQVPDEGIEAT